MDFLSENICVFVSFLFFLQKFENGLPAHFCDPAASAYPGDVVHSHHGEGSDGGVDRPCPSGDACQLSCALCLISLSSPGGNGADWRTQTCGTTAASTTSQEFGCARPPKKLVKKEGLHKMPLVAPEIRGGFLFCRVASGGAGADGPLRGLLLGLLFGVPGPALHHVQGRTLLLHWTVSSLRRYQLSLTMCR